MATLPDRPSTEQLRKLARDTQRAVRTGDPDALRRAGLDSADPDFPLARAQLLIARRYGFPSWSRMRRQVETISARTWTMPADGGSQSPADRYLRAVCLNFHTDESREVVVGPPASDNAGVAAAAYDVGSLRAILRRDPTAATRPTGPYGWSPLLYAAYSRGAAARADAVATVEILLAGGADPNDGRFFDGTPLPFTVLTGVFGGGEGAQPVHPHCAVLALLLLSRGAEANDGQTLYNRMFTDADDFLEILFPHGLGRGDGGPWRRLLPDLIAAPADQLRQLLGWAVLHDQRARVGLLGRHGVDLAGPLADGRTPYQCAAANGHIELCELLLDLGAGAATALDPVDAAIAAILAGETPEAPADVLAAARIRRPDLVVWATALARPAAVRAAIAAGFGVDAFGRADLPAPDRGWQTALHTAVERQRPDIARALLDAGADASLVDARFGATPADWAAHLGVAGFEDLFPADGARSTP